MLGAAQEFDQQHNQGGRYRAADGCEIPDAEAVAEGPGDDQDAEKANDRGAARRPPITSPKNNPASNTVNRGLEN